MLNLGHNHIDENGAKILGDLNHPVALDLMGNRVGKEGAEILVKY